MRLRKHIAWLVSLTLVAAALPMGCASQQEVIKQPTAAFDRHRHANIAPIVEVRAPVTPAITQATLDETMNAISGKGYHVIAGSDAGKVKQEMLRQQGGMTDKNAAELGRELNAGAILVVTINSASVSSTTQKFEGTETTYEPNAKGKLHPVNRPSVQYQTVHTAHVALSARLIDVSTQELLWINSTSGNEAIDTPSNLDAAVSRATSRLIKTFPPLNPALQQ